MYELLYLLLKTVKLPRLEHIIFKIVLLVVLGHTCVSLGQLDIPRIPITIEGLQNNEAPRSVLVSPENLTGMVSSGTLVIKSKMNLSEPLPGKEKRQARFMEGEKFAKKEYAALESKMNKKFAKENTGLRPEFYKDQYLGDFRSGSKFVRFLYRDHEFVDGDRVSVSINDVVIHPNIYLQGEFQGFYIDLEKGFNKIDITALNQGTSGPNTAQFIMYGDQKEIISSNIWNLATGVTATIIIVKD